MSAAHARPEDREGIAEGAVVSLALMAGISGGWFTAVALLDLPVAPWRPLVAAVVLVLAAVLARHRRWLIALVGGAGLGSLLAWVAYVGGGFVVSHF